MLIGNGHQIKFKNGKKIGIIRSDGVFTSFKEKKKHFFRLYNGWSLNKELLNELKDIQTHTIEIVTKDTREIYSTNLSNFFNNGINYRNPKDEKDYQIILPLSFWNVRQMDDKIGELT